MRKPAFFASNALRPSRSASHTTWFAITIRLAPVATPTDAWKTVAKVRPHAPIASCSANSSGDIVVLPCGASSMPLRRAKSCIHRRLCTTADRRSTAMG